MSISCDQSKARMMELLYGELSGPDRAEIESHVTGCTSCQTELAGFQRTRATVRGALEQPVPLRARDAILRAAAAQVAAAAGANRVSLWDWLRRRWALPTLATVGAVAVFVLASRMFLKPETMMGNRGIKSPVAPEAELEGLAAPQPAAPAQPPAAPEASPTPREAPAPVVAAPAPTYGAAARAERQVSAGKQDRRRKAAATHKDAPKPTSLDELSTKALAKGSLDQEGLGRSFAAPPPPREPERMKAEDKAAAAAPAPAAKPAKKSFADAPAGPAPAVAPAAAPPPVAAQAAPTAESTRSGGGSSAKAKRRVYDAEDDAEAGSENPARRADQLFARGRWAEAVAAYRVLLQNDPQNADAPRWRRRLAAAEENARREATPETP